MKNVISYFLVGLLAVIVSVFFKGEYEALIRFLLPKLSGVRLIPPKLYLDFSIPYPYLISFPILFISLFYILRNRGYKQLLLSFLIVVVLFLIITTVCTALYGKALVIRCTQCDDGIWRMQWGDVNYNSIYFISIVLSYIPVMVNLVRIRKDESSHLSSEK
jgi:hypothetical protein